MSENIFFRVLSDMSSAKQKKRTLDAVEDVPY